MNVVLFYIALIAGVIGWSLPVPGWWWHLAVWPALGALLTTRGLPWLGIILGLIAGLNS